MAQGIRPGLRFTGPQAAQAQSQVAVNLHLTGATLKEVVTEIRKQAHVDIVYSNEDIRQLAPKNYNMEKASIGEVIDYALGGSNLTYEIKNGVIVITTKRGRVGKPTVRYSMNVNMKRRPRYSDRSIDVMNSKDRIQLSRELYNDEYIYPSNISMVGYEGALHQLYTGQINQAQFNTLVDNLETMNTDWFDLLTDDSFSHSHTVSIDGGSETSRYYASVGYNRDNDVVKGNHDERYTAILNLDTEFNR